MKDNRSDIFSATHHLTQDQLMRYNLGQLSKEEQHTVEMHLVDCELCKDALAGMYLIPDYKSINKIRREIRRLAKPRTDSMNKVARRIVITTAAVLALLLLIVLFYLYYINKVK